MKTTKLLRQGAGGTLFIMLAILLLSFFPTTSVSACSVSLTIDKQDATCFGGSDGAVTLIPGNNPGPISYQWSTGASSASISGLSPGHYQFTVTDGDECTTSGNVYIGQAAKILGAYTKNDLVCFGADNGSAALNPSGGHPPYTYAWSHGPTTQSVSGLSAGAYSFTITDSENCTGNGSFSILEPSPLLSTFVQQNPTSLTSFNGSITVSGYGGTPPYTVNWNTGFTGSTITGLGVGMYIYTISDAAGCEGRGGVVCLYVESSDLIVNVLNSTVACDGQDNGSASLIVTGGTQPYEFNWSNGANTALVTGLSPGSYGYTVTDAVGEGASGQVFIPEAIAPVSSITVIQEPTTNTNGALEASGSGGVPPYTYAWNSGQNTAAISNLDYGTYVVTVTDFNGCYDVSSVNFGCPNIEYPGNIGSNQYLCAPGNDPAAFTSLSPASGGSGDPIEYLWMYTTDPNNNDFQYWTPIPNSNSATYDAGPLYQTTYFARCARRGNCPFLESNVLTVTVGSDAYAELILPELGCVFQNATLAALTGTGTNDVSWTLSGPVTPTSATGPQIEVYFTGGGPVYVTVAVTENNCTAYANGQILVGNNEELCNAPFVPGNNVANRYAGFTSMKIAPNPVTNQTTINLEVPLEANTTIQMIDMTQRLVQEKIFPAGERRLVMDMSAQPAGLYFVRLQNELGQSELMKLIKQ